MAERIIKNQPLEVAVVRYPGSNCDWDTLEFFNRNGHHAEFLWHKDINMPEADLLVLCGGFAFGDRVYDKATGLYRMNPGVQALKSPVHKTIERSQGGKHNKAAKPTTTDVWRQYDWRVGVRTIKGPNQPGHFAILDLPEINKELVVSWSSDEGRSDIDPRIGIEHAFQRAYRYIEANRAIPLGLTNCLNFGHPRDSMGAFAETVEGLGKMCRNYDVPVVGGNVSLYNSTGEHSIKPTPVLVMVGIKDKN